MTRGMITGLARRLPEAGRIRIGQQVPAGKGKMRPEKLATFRLTSPDRVKLDAAARLYGGEVRAWQAPSGPQWEVITAADALEVIVPPSDMAFSQAYEMWSGGGCLRRCDGVTESLSDGPCVCDPEARECAIHTRLSVMLRDVPGLAVWRLDTSGYYAATELQAGVDVIRAAAARGHMLPARLLLEQRTVKRPGPEGKPVTRRFAVPVLDIHVPPGQLVAGDGRGELAQADAAAAIEAPAAADDTRSGTRDNPRAAGAASARGAQPRPPQDRPADRASPAALIAMHFQRLGIPGRDERLNWTAHLTGREITSTNDLDEAEQRQVLDDLSRCADIGKLQALIDSRKQEAPDASN